MKESRFIHLDPDEDQFKDRLSKKMLTGESLITHKDISNYVDEMILRLKKRTHRNSSNIFMMDGLSDDALIKKYFQLRIPLLTRIFARVNMDARDEVNHPRELYHPEQNGVDIMKAEIRRIREAVQEEFKKRLTHDPELYGINYSDVQWQLSAPFSASAYVKRMRDLNGKQPLFRREKLISRVVDEEGEHDFVELNSEERAQRTKALKSLAQIPPCENLLLPTQYDISGFETLAEEIDLQDESIDSRIARWKNRRPLSEDLMIARDCMRGAKVLLDHGIALQDISDNNMGSYKKDGRRVGILFDLEGVYPVNAPLRGRLCNKFIIPPEVSMNRSTPVRSSEVVYQLGLGFSNMVIDRIEDESISEVLRGKMAGVCGAMMYYDASSKNSVEKRIDLETAIHRMDELVGLALEQEYPPSSAQEERLAA